MRTEGNNESRISPGLAGVRGEEEEEEGASG